MTTLELKDTKTVPDPIHTYPKSVRNATPLVIDNGECIDSETVLQISFLDMKCMIFLCISLGSYQCRVGWATQKEPLLIFKNLIAKPRRERGKKVME
jgi:actin-related protein 5